MSLEDNELFIRKTERAQRLEILKKLPSPYVPTEYDTVKISESDIEKLENIIDTVKQGKSYIEHIKSKREYNNPENIQRIIDHYRIEEIASNIPSLVYNPYNVVRNADEYYDGIIKKQNEIMMKNKK